MRGDTLKDFKAFILRGNVVDLAVGVIIGAAFTAIITSLVQDVITPLLGLVNLPDFADASVGVGKADLRYGKFINAIVSFILIGFVIFFFVVRPLNRLMGRGKEEDEPKNRECPHCLSSIPREAVICAFCTREVVPDASSSGPSRSRR